MKRYWWVFLIAAPLMGILMGSLQIYYGLNLWKYDGPKTVFEIKSGETFGKINHRLGESDLIFSKKLFHRYCQIQGIMKNFKIGKYEIPSQINMLQLIDLLQNGQSIQTSVTIPEGKNLYEIAKILEDKKITKAKDFIREAKNKNLLNQLEIPGERFEGYLYPDTYFLSEDLASQEVIKIMVRNFKTQTKALNLQTENLDKREIVILASIVEKETGAKHERPVIAGVFHNRLRKRMRLQSDPTTIYGIWESWNGNLRKKHLLEKTPYNTYKIPALPVGPISNPGLDAIKAVLNPATHDYLYFVSQNDGTHVFSRTYKEHKKAVETWQLNRRNRKGKSWRDLKQ
ncbi:MAG: endolytic transglycosylase MltG [Bacteriovoracaceae bacterium]